MKVFHGLVVTWCLLLALSLATEVEETVEMASMAGTEAKKLYNGLPKQDLPVVVQKGISAMDQYDAENGEMVTMNKKLIKRLSAPWKTKIAKECCQYNRIPWFKLGFMGKEYNRKSKSDCTSLCNQYMTCKSFSYSFKHKKCIWSPQAVTYDANWRFYSKKLMKNGAPDGTYHMFPGMKFLEPTTDIEKNKSLQQCQYSCTKELGCNSFSFSPTFKECARSGQKVGYSDEWDYYEKDLNNKGMSVVLNAQAQESKLKSGLKREYIHNVDKIRREELAEGKKEHARKVDAEKTIKADNKEEEEAEKEMAVVEKNKERRSKTASKTKAMGIAFARKMSATIKKIDKLEKGTLEKIQKKLVTESDDTTVAELTVEKKAATDTLDMLKKKFNKAKVAENGEKNALRKADEKKEKADEKAQKGKEKEKADEEKKKLDKEDQKEIKNEKKAVDCKTNIREHKEKADMISVEERKAKSFLSAAENRIAKWFSRANSATREVDMKKYKEFHKEAKESANKHTSDEQKLVKKEMSARSETKKVKAKCKAKEVHMKKYAKKVAAEKKLLNEKKRDEEAAEKRLIKEQDIKQKESETKEEASKETNQKESIQKAKIERASKEQKQKSDDLKEKTKKMEKKMAETDAKHKVNKEKIKRAEMAALKVGEASEKTKEKERLEYNEKYKKESAEKEVAEKDSQKMTIETNEKEKVKADKREQEADAKHAAKEAAVLEAKTEKKQKVAMENLSKAEEKKFKARMKRPHLSAVRRNDAGIIKVPGPSGTIMVGGGVINHYRKWNDASIFEESYPDGDQWRCDMGVGNRGQATCISLSYKMPKGTKCVNARAYTANAGVIHATLPPGYMMVSGGVQNLIRKFDRQGAFEESMPSGDRKWRCDMGFGRGELNCFVRGCKFPHGAHCVTTEASSNNAGWVWAECPEGYQVMGCGMRNNYLNFDPKSGFEDLRPVGNKCLGDMGFGPGRVSVYARCCKVNGPPPKIKAPAPPPAAGTANPDSIKCLSQNRWEQKKASDCMGGDIETITLSGKGAVIQDQLDTCAQKCMVKQGCVGFTFPSKGGKGNRCKLKGDGFANSDELKKVCDSYTATQDYDSYAKLSGPCTGSKVDTSSMVRADRRRIKIRL